MATEDIVRVIRVLEYVGPRTWVEETLARNAVKGEQRGRHWIIREATLGQFFETVGTTEEKEVTHDNQ